MYKQIYRNMKRNYFFVLFFVVILIGCNQNATTTTDAAVSTTEATTSHGQSGVQDETSAPDVVKIAVGSKDHTTLVTALQAADLVNALSNAGPFTVFAPVNAAFDKLPKGTVEGLLKPDQKDALIDVLQYHVYVGVLKADQLSDGQSLGMVSGKNATVSMKDGKTLINGKAQILTSIPASNGIIHVIDEVLLAEN